MTQQTINKIKSVMSSCETHEQLDVACQWVSRLIVKEIDDANFSIFSNDGIRKMLEHAELIEHSMVSRTYLEAKIKTNVFIDKCIESFKHPHSRQV